MSSGITATVLFDAGYLEPALVTAFQLQRFAEQLEGVVLVLLEDDAEDADAARAVVAQFCSELSRSSRLPFRAISARGGLARFDVHHFNASILYKALLPSLVDCPGWLLNIDAGLLPGGRFGDFLEDSKLALADNSEWLIAAHVHDPATMLPPALAGLDHHRLYPAGNLLLFEPRRCRAQHWRERFEAAYDAHRPQLRYAEQELICLVATEHELRELPRGEQRCTPFLGIESLVAGDDPGFVDLEPLVYFKFVGSLKPWKSWVLDPQKRIYLLHRQALEAALPLSAFELIQKHRQRCAQPAWALGFQQAYEQGLLARSKPCEAAA